MSLCVMFGIAESFSPTTSRIIVGGISRPILAALDSIVDDASASIFDPMVADHKDTRSSVLVHEVHIPRDWSRNNGSRSTSASSSTRVRTLGNDARFSEEVVDNALKSRPGVVTRMSAFANGREDLLV